VRFELVTASCSLYLGGHGSTAPLKQRCWSSMFWDNKQPLPVHLLFWSTSQIIMRMHVSGRWFYNIQRAQTDTMLKDWVRRYALLSFIVRFSSCHAIIIVLLLETTTTIWCHHVNIKYSKSKSVGFLNQ